MTPKLIHFVYVGGRPFSFIHFLAVYTAWKVNRPDKLYLHYSEEPQGPWWEKARPLLTLNRVAPVDSVFGNPVMFPAHQADVIRLQMLRRYGGIYLDLDIICLRPFTPLLTHDFVMGIEPGSGLCNAVIIAKPEAVFLRHWWENYRNFDGSRWNQHSVVLPYALAQSHPAQIHVADQYAFFYPAHNDPVHRYLWGQGPGLGELASRLLKNALRRLQQLFSLRRTPHPDARQRNFHALRGAGWHYQRARQSYCLHLWEGLWGEPYLQAVTPDYLRQADSHFARLLREILSEDELQAFKSPGPLALLPEAS